MFHLPTKQESLQQEEQADRGQIYPADVAVADRELPGL